MEDARVFGGTPLSTDDLRKGVVFTARDVPGMEYAWDTGQAIGRYLEELRNGRLVGRRCRACARVLIPPRMHCERCWRATDAWVILADTGTVNTFSLCSITWDMVRLRRPQIPAVIDIDGSAGGILHLLGGVAPSRVRVGMRVKAVWRSKRERMGAITDIRFWRPL
jgi:hypothetical protein